MYYPLSNVNAGIADQIRADFLSKTNFFFDSKSKNDKPIRKHSEKEFRDLPAHEEVAERFIHRIERLRAEQDRLIVRWVVYMVGGSIEFERTQFRFVHFGQLSG